MPGSKDVGDLALVDEDGRLALAHGQLGAVFDLVAMALEAVDQRVRARIVEPFDDIDELAEDLVHQRHVAFVSRIVQIR